MCIILITLIIGLLTARDSNYIPCQTFMCTYLDASLVTIGSGLPIIHRASEMANQEKQQKRGFMYIYKGGTGNQRKKELEHGVGQEKKSNSRSWLHRISRTKTFIGVRGHKDLDTGGGEFVEARKSTSCLELGSPAAGGFVEGRKSVSYIESAASPAPRGSIVFEEGRESVFHIEKNFAAGGMVEARKSVSHIETFSSVASYLQVKVLVSDMPSFMQVHAFRCARRTYDSLEKFSSKHIAHNIKKEFDKAYGPVWHCIVGSSFGSFVTHSTGCFLYFSMENLYILLFKTKVKKVLD